jgi:NodT family efflux transporter outer membrane factor (OMF) lipoprotein
VLLAAPPLAAALLIAAVEGSKMHELDERRMGRSWQLLAAAAVALVAGTALTATAAEPTLKSPQPLVPPGWSTTLPQAPVTDGPAEMARWWERLNDPLLTQLELRAIGGSLDLRAAEARLREARARRAQAGAERLPSANLSGSASHTSTDESGSSRYSLGAAASWDADVFGQRRNSARAAAANAEASQQALYDARVSLAAELALSYLDVRVSQKRLATTSANLALQQDTFDIARWRHEAGLTTQLDVEQAQLAVEQVRAQLPSLRTTLEQSKNRVAVLLGQAPGSLDAELDRAADVPVAPLAVTVGVPADLLRRRPDVRRAEYELMAQVYQRRATRASRYPQLTLKGSIGLESLAAGDLLSTAARVVAGALNLGQTLFDGGRIRQQLAIQTAVQEQAAVAYDAAVLAAFEDVENALVAYVEEEARRQSLARAATLARSAADLARDRYRSGLVDFQVVLEAQRSLLSAEDQLVTSSGNLASNLVRLYRALGGGWTPGSAA